MTRGSYWAVAQTVSKMEHIVRREIEKTNHGTFLPTMARHWWVDGRRYTKERPALTGYVFFKTDGDDWAGIPDIHGVYRVMVIRSIDPLTGKTVDARDAVTEPEMKRLVFSHICRDYDETMPPRYTKYYRPPSAEEKRKQKRRRPRRSKRARSHTAQ